MKKEHIIILICIVVALVGGSVYIKQRIRLNATTSDVGTDTSNSIVTGIRLDWDIPKYKHLVIPDREYLTSGSGSLRPYETIVEIGDSAFAGNTYLETVYIPASITRIQKNAFRDCSSIYEVNYEGSKEQWNKIVIEAGNDIFRHVTINYNVEAPVVDD